MPFNDVNYNSFFFILPNMLESKLETYNRMKTLDLIIMHDYYNMLHLQALQIKMLVVLSF